MTNYDIMSKIFVWANSDLDGACSTILLGNIFPNMEYKSVFFGDFLTQWKVGIDYHKNLGVIQVGILH